MAYKNKETQKQFAKKHYEANKDEYLKKAKAFNIKAKIRNKEYILNFLLEHPCIDCGESDPIVLDFDHVIGNKLKNISDAVKTSWSIKKLQEEMNKCEIRCANCHRRVTHQRRTSTNSQ